MTSGAYAKDYNEVKELGAVGSSRTPEQAALAGFFTNTPRPRRCTTARSAQSR